MRFAGGSTSNVPDIGEVAVTGFADLEDAIVSPTPMLANTDGEVELLRDLVSDRVGQRPGIRGQDVHVLRHPRLVAVRVDRLGAEEHCILP